MTTIVRGADASQLDRVRGSIRARATVRAGRSCTMIAADVRHETAARSIRAAV